MGGGKRRPRRPARVAPRGGAVRVRRGGVLASLRAAVRARGEQPPAVSRTRGAPRLRRRRGSRREMLARRARAGTTPNPASVGVGPFRSRPWRRRRPPPRGSPRARRRGRRSLVARARRRSSPAPSPAHRGGCTGTAGSPRTLSLSRSGTPCRVRNRAPREGASPEPAGSVAFVATAGSEVGVVVAIPRRFASGAPSGPATAPRAIVSPRAGDVSRNARGRRPRTERHRVASGARRASRDARAAPQRGEPRASKGVHVTRSGCDGRCARRHLSEPSARLTE